MWCVEPNILCRNHLLGEHLELHMFVGTILAKKSLDGYIKSGLLDTSKIEKRHKELVKEMKKRGYNHKSILPSFKVKNKGFVDKNKNIKELFKRCERCRKLIKENNISF